jgi:phospholipid/cholesterol/gamma-HCH transport system permease protein
MTDTQFHIEADNTLCKLVVSGNWELGKSPDGAALIAAIPADTTEIQLEARELGQWDSSLAIGLLQVARWSNEKNIHFNSENAPQGLQQLLRLATDVPAYEQSSENKPTSLSDEIYKNLTSLGQEVRATLTFIGETSLALMRWLSGGAKTRRSDIFYFIQQAGPQALAIVTLISVLVGMILAYLGSVQLRQLGAQVYVANLVSLGMVREMGALMTAVIMAGRTGAAYAAQLGTMQVNDEIDALKVMGIPSIEFLVLPRMLALIFVMPLLCIYADIIGMVGGALTAANMDVSFTQYILQTQDAVDWVDISTGIVKSIFFGVLIAIAGCQAGLQCGRNSNAVGMAATNAVVRAIVYLVLADAAFNILFDKLGI